MTLDIVRFQWRKMTELYMSKPWFHSGDAYVYSFDLSHSSLYIKPDKPYRHRYNLTVGLYTESK